MENRICWKCDSGKGHKMIFIAPDKNWDDIYPNPYAGFYVCPNCNNEIRPKKAGRKGK